MLTMDTAADSRVAELVAQAATAARAYPVVIRYETNPTSAMEPTPAGTDITARNGGVPVHLRGLPATEPGQTVMLSGQVSWNPVEATQQGTVVFDGGVWPPDELGLLRSPVRCRVVDGRVVEIEGDTDAAVFRQWMASHGDADMYRVTHWSLGFNPGVTKPTGRIVEDERVFGGVEFGLGTKGAWLGGDTWVAAAHTDGSMLRPSIFLDGEAIEVDGVYVHPDVVAACRPSGIPGY